MLPLDPGKAWQLPPKYAYCDVQTKIREFYSQLSGIVVGIVVGIVLSIVVGIEKGIVIGILVGILIGILVGFFS